MPDYSYTESGTFSYKGELYRLYITTAPWRDYYNSIKRVIITQGVTSIGDNAFVGCGALTDVTIPEGVTSIGKRAFWAWHQSSLTSITIPSSLTNIGADAFGYCGNLTDVYITDLEAYCCINYCGNGSCPFQDSFKTHRLYLDGNLVTDLVIPSSATYITDYLFNCCTSLRSVTIPDSVTNIGSHAFYGCSSLMSVTIPNSVTSIGSHAFYNCSMLKNITIPSSVTRIGGCAFYGCNSMTAVYITDVDAWCNIVFDEYRDLRDNYDKYYANPIYYAHNLYLDGELVTNLVIPNSVTSISDFLFYGCSSLMNIEMQEGVSNIGRKAFADCSSLTNIKIPNSVTSIGENAFSG